MRLLTLFALFLLCVWQPMEAAAATAPAMPERETPEGQSVFSRRGQFGACEALVIPFQHPQRPTVFLEAGGVTLPMLFDTGAFTSLYINDGQFLNPGFTPLADSQFLAGLDGKQAQLAERGGLDYRSLALVRLGGVRLRNVPFRVYAEGQAQRDFAGAISAALFQDFVIEVCNSRGELVLHRPEVWRPANPAHVLPMLALPRGLFVQLEIGHLAAWLHLDTGFSGTIGILPQFSAAHPELFTTGQGDPQQFQAWDDNLACPPLEIAELAVPPYGDYTWAAPAHLRLTDVEGVIYDRDYSTVTGIEVAGIMGSGFLADFNYAIDYGAGRLYILGES